MTQEIILTNFGNLKAYPFKMTKTTNSFEAKDFFGNIEQFTNTEIYFERVDAVITSPINNLNYNIIWDGKNRCKKIITKRVV